MQWLRLLDAHRASGLLSTAFATNRRRSVVRFAAKVVLVPHLATTDGLAVVGLERHPRRTLVLRLADGLIWALTPRARPFRPDHLPRPLRRSAEWRAFNLAASPDADPGDAVGLARTVASLADRHGATLVVDVADSSLRAAYLRHGFEESATPDRLVRSPRPVVLW